MKGEEETVRISVGLRKELYDKLADFTKQRGFLSISEAIRYIIANYFEKGGEK